MSSGTTSKGERTIVSSLVEDEAGGGGATVWATARPARADTRVAARSRREAGRVVMVFFPMKGFGARSRRAHETRRRWQVKRHVAAGGYDSTSPACETLNRIGPGSAGLWPAADRMRARRPRSRDIDARAAARKRLTGS